MKTSSNAALAPQEVPHPPLVQRVTVQEAAALSRRHPVTVYRALEDGSLHGAQQVKGGRWLIRLECLDAWIDSTQCDHQAQGQADVISLADRRRKPETAR